MKKGMSLIVLVITILVMIILAGVVVVGLSNNNPIGQANSAKALTDLANAKQQVSLYASNKLGSAYNADGTAKDTTLVTATTVPNAVVELGAEITVSKLESKEADTTVHYYEITDAGYTEMAVTKTSVAGAKYAADINGNLILVLPNETAFAKLASDYNNNPSVFFKAN